MLTLSTYFRSSASYRVRIALGLKGLDYTPDVVWLPSGEQAQPAYRERNPQGLVPLLDDGNVKLAQSLAIMEYLDEIHPEPPLLPGDAVQRARIRSLSLLVACDMHPLNNLRVLKYLKSEMKQEQDAVDTWYRHWCTEGLTAYEAEVKAHGGQFSCGDQVTMADVCLVPQIANAKRFETDLTPYPLTMAIYERCVALPAFDAAQPSKQPEASRAA